jgi:hypothetical protein
MAGYVQFDDGSDWKQSCSLELAPVLGQGRNRDRKPRPIVETDGARQIHRRSMPAPDQSGCSTHTQLRLSEWRHNGPKIFKEGVPTSPLRMQKAALGFGRNL